MLVNILTQCIPSPLFEGMWRHDADRTATGYRTLSHWLDIGRRLEEAGVDALFFADTYGMYDVYGGSAAASLRHSVQVPAIDPVTVIPAIASVTRGLGFAVTLSTSYHAPFHCARVFSSLDHLTDGRIGWNIVTSDPRLGAGTGMADRTGHDERYDRADEYLDIVVGLWEDSWDGDAVVIDRAGDTFTDPTRVRPIEVDGRWFRVASPHQCEPSPQRTPVLYQAGSSPRGQAFAARHAEVVFVALNGMRQGREQVDGMRCRTAESGRDPDRLKVLQAMALFVAEDEAEARRQAEDYVRLTSAGGLLAKWCGWTGLDLASLPDAMALTALRQDGMGSVSRFLDELGGDRELTVGDLRRHVSTARRPHLRAPLTLIGTPGQVADRLETWLERTGVDGFNLMPCPPTAGLDAYCRLLAPELRRRGLVPPNRVEPLTLRERYLGAGVRDYQRARPRHDGAEQGVHGTPRPAAGRTLQ